MGVEFALVDNLVLIKRPTYYLFKNNATTKHVTGLRHGLATILTRGLGR
jgi:hypothetical protein